MAVSSLSVLCRSACLFVLLAGPASAFGEDHYTSDKVYDDDGKWTVSVNTTRKSCMMHMVYEDDTVIEVGGDRRDGELTHFFMFGNTSWTYRKGRTYEVIAEYDRSIWTGEGVGVRVNDYKGVAVEGVTGEAVEDFAGGSTLHLKIGKSDYGNYNLAGTRRGLAKMRECIEAIEDGSLSLEEIGGDEQADVKPQPKGNDDDKPAARPDDGGNDEETAYSSGTAFFVNGDGYLITNAHVVEGCGDAEVRRDGGMLEPATILARDETGDLALLKTAKGSPAFGTFRGTPPIRLGDTVVVFGYPLTDFLSKTGNLATGLVASLAGAGDDETQMQISAPVQSGNSGGAVVDQSGHVVGIVVAKANIQNYASGDEDDIEVIQNVNFAIKAGEARDFLDEHDVRYSVEPPGEDMRTPDVAEIARKFSAQVICEVKE